MMTWHLICTGETRNAYKILIRNLEWAGHFRILGISRWIILS